MVNLGFVDGLGELEMQDFLSSLLAGGKLGKYINFLVAKTKVEGELRDLFNQELERVKNFFAHPGVALKVEGKRDEYVNLALEKFVVGDFSLGDLSFDINGAGGISIVIGKKNVFKKI